MQGLFISGSGTNVGKTFIATQIIKILSDKYLISVRKPVESDCQNGIAKDAQALLEASNTGEDINTVCPYQFSLCASGELASKNSKINLTLKSLVKACESNNFIIVEGAGGLYSPICANTLNVDLAKALNLDTILVVKDELGAVNQALLTIQAAQNNNLNIKCVILNQIQNNSLNNAKSIAQYSDIPIVVYQQGFKEDIFNLLVEA